MFRADQLPLLKLSIQDTLVTKMVLQLSNVRAFLSSQCDFYISLSGVRICLQIFSLDEQLKSHHQQVYVKYNGHCSAVIWIQVTCSIKKEVSCYIQPSEDAGHKQSLHQHFNSQIN